jgi:hypothetical protein
MRTTPAQQDPTGWERIDVVVDGRTQPILRRRTVDAASGETAVAVVAVQPRLVIAAGLPRLNLTLQLIRQPTVAEPSIHPLIERSLTAFTVTVGLPADTLAAIYGPSSSVRPLFAHRAVFTLERDAMVLSRVEASGPDATAAFSLWLERAPTLEVLAALEGADSPMVVRCRVDYRVIDRPGEIRLQGRWAALHDALATPPPYEDETLDRAQVSERLQGAVKDGVITVSGDDPPDAARLLEVFLRMSGPLLAVQAAGGETRYRLKPRLHAAMTFDATFQVPSCSMQTLDLSAPLGEILGGCLDTVDADRCIRVVAPDGDGGLSPVARRAVGAPSRGPRGKAIPGRASLGRVGVGGSAAALSAIARPAATLAVNAHVLLANATVEPQAVGSLQLHHWTVDDLAIVGIAGGGTGQRRLPIVADPAAPLWNDRVAAAARWYAPAFSIDMPAANADPKTSPFLFEFHTAGHTATGAAGLEGAVRFRVRRTMSDATRTAWEAAGQPAASPVATIGVSVALAIPFRDQTGATRMQAFPAELSIEGDLITARIGLLDDWLRLAYGALAIDGFQKSRAQVRIAYTFEAYVPLRQNQLALLFDRKAALTAIARRDLAAGETRHPPYLDAATLTYRTAATTVTFTHEAPITDVGSRRRSSTTAAGTRSAGTASAARAADTRPIAIAAADHSIFAIRPSLSAATDLSTVIGQYGVQTLGHEHTVDALFPCATLGAFYRQQRDEGDEAIGCREAFTLGQTTFRAYEKLDDPAFASPEYSVWRSLQQPGRFLLVPARYAIVRFGRDDADRAYRPAIFLYSTVDADQPANNQCAVLASLAPDVSSAARRALERKLTSLAAQPVIALINAIDADVAYDWSVPATGPLAAAKFHTTKLHDGFQVSIACAIDAAPLLQKLLQTSGAIGSARFTLPDGTRIETALVLDLNRIVGPAPDGPITCTLDAGHCTLTNAIDRAVDVHDLLVETASGALDVLPIDRRFAPAASEAFAVAADAAAAYVEATPASGDAATLTEIRSFIEDVHTNVAFLNLINYENHALAALSLEARLRGVAGTQTLALDANVPVSALEFVLPLTVYLADPVVEFSVTKTMTTGITSTTSWREWSLPAQGNVISLTWDGIQ